jgi:hypothetical protein
MRTSRYIALAAAVILAACANQQQPAEQAVAKVDASLNEIAPTPSNTRPISCRPWTRPSIA